MSNLQSTVKRNLAELLDVDVDRIALDANLSDGYGLTSLNLVLLMTSLCEETGIPVFSFTDKDIASLRTPRDVVTLFATAGRQEA
ncbi:MULTISPECIES: acyl carrier protein [unclassified Bradyrhizobium]|uniref:acyl carrier protein n=1 Tax=unclassified Bradyrhizobium TaxID=2631580 RepID=UPI001CD7EB76|nr:MULTISPECIES: acyl carrier protein [unclassified Bradyrhizobium]MCA1438363.1 acyl carrier protein [Bradyrhizobium sp. BRP20]MCA1473112.1 acyl carrier protein [Bradyrhizobium sp. IC3195]MCA1501919.1 acyl carrier protein [Bradyrhizobium sp. NBAIM14]MCA1552349.1 acyl carrier protein [Bradyrhizobium sp. BRP19]